MDEIEDGDLSLQRASSGAISSIKKRLKYLLRDSIGSKSDQRAADDASRICGLLDMFQEDPQLLDPHLKDIVSPTLSHFLALIQRTDFQRDDANVQTQVKHISQTVCMLCKVRGKKVISRFMANEPRYVIPMLDALRIVSRASSSPMSMRDQADDLAGLKAPSNIDQQYVILLWLSHLVLTPFDLESLSSGKGDNVELPHLRLPDNLPSVAIAALRAGIESLNSATNRQNIAAMLLTRLCLRPDMHQRGLVKSMVAWALSTLERVTDAVSIHKAIGLLLFLNGIVASANIIEVAPHLQLIHTATNKVFQDASERFETIQQSAAAKRQSIKIQRNIVVQLLQSRENSDKVIQKVVKIMLDSQGVLEEVVDYLLRLLSDRDTQVRMAASKALSVIALKLDSDMAEEIVDAVLASLNEDVLESESGKSLTSVNPVRWHGLVLTLSHMLFRRTPSPNQLVDVLQALYLALTFEQKSPSGSSIGGNVRDAANFGLWSLARRYSTAELLATPSSDPRCSTIQATANNLLCVACLDPIGNVRRGSSASLQELVGRHPDMIKEGISLIQIVDYHAVGKRSRALKDVLVHAARLDQSYRKVFLKHIYDWRGVSASDRPSQEVAACAVGELVQPMAWHQMSVQVQHAGIMLQKTHVRAVHRRQGLLLCLAQMVSAGAKSNTGPGRTTPVSFHDITGTRSSWEFFDICLEEVHETLVIPSKQSRIIAVGVLALAEAIAAAQEHLLLDSGAQVKHYPSVAATKQVVQCLRQVDYLFPDSFRFGKALALEDRAPFVDQLLTEIKQAYRPTRVPAVIRALSFMYPYFGNSRHSLEIHDKILKSLLDIASPSNDIESRVLALRGLGCIMAASHDSEGSYPRLEADAACRILNVLIGALDDYTTNERGDLGSLVRLEALQAFGGFQLQDWEESRPAFGQIFLPYMQCQQRVLRLSLERLDKVRLQAVHTMSHTYRVWYSPSSNNDSVTSIVDIGIPNVSDYRHFYGIARFMNSTSDRAISERDIKGISTSIVHGFAMSAGAGSSTLQAVARAALCDTFDSLPIYLKFEAGQMSGSAEEVMSSNLSLFDVGEIIQDLLTSNQGNDRVLLPLLETIAFLLDASILQRLSVRNEVTSKSVSRPFRWLTFLSSIQKSHYKTSSIPKLFAAVAVYRGLCDVPEIRQRVLTKMLGMLSHPFPSVRAAVAEALFVVTEEERLVDVNWTGPTNENKEIISAIKESLKLKE